MNEKSKQKKSYRTENKAIDSVEDRPLPSISSLKPKQILESDTKYYFLSKLVDQSLADIERFKNFIGG